MIGKLTGNLSRLDNGKALIDVNGVGYVVNCSARTLNALGGEGASVSVLVETQVREDAITLVGFADAAEKSAFQILTGVQGVGTRVALSILSTLSPEHLSAAIQTGDKATLSTPDGVGPKLAARLATELKDKAHLLGAPAVIGFAATGARPPTTSGIASDAISTLCNLGFRRDQAFGTVMALLSDKKEIGFDELIRLSLQELGAKR